MKLSGNPGAFFFVRFDQLSVHTSERLFYPLTVGDVLHNTRYSVNTGCTFDGKVGDEYVSLAKLWIHVFHLVSDDFASETLIQSFFNDSLKHSPVQYFV